MLTVLAAGLSFGLADPAAAQKSKITVQAVAKAIVVTQLSFFKVDDINFGKIIAGTTAGNVSRPVTLDAGGAGQDSFGRSGHNPRTSSQPRRFPAYW